MFIDKAKVIVKGGNGGDGCMSFRREKYIPKGGPNGGDGGKGGNVFFRANPHLKTLLDFSRHPKYEARRGDNGRGRKQSGRSGEDLIVDVPCGTIVYDGDSVLADLLMPGDQLLVSKGGRGGRGNVHFKNSVRQAPRISERGEPGDARHLQLKLKVIADIGFVGLPNAGKSTLLSRLTRAHPKVADYPFTTLYPNLGVAEYHNREIVFADIPGLIEGSHEGKGLGHEFLQHVERTRVLIHVVDPMGFGPHSPKENIKIIRNELKRYSRVLAKKPEILVVNKQDLTGAEKVFKALARAYRTRLVMPISGVSGHGIPELLAEAVKTLDSIPDQYSVVETKPVRISLEPEYWIERNEERFFVHGKNVERLVVMTNFDLPEAVERTQFILKKIGVERSLMAKGAKAGDMITIGSIEFSFEPIEVES